MKHIYLIIDGAGTRIGYAEYKKLHDHDRTKPKAERQYRCFKEQDGKQAHNDDITIYHYLVHIHSPHFEGFKDEINQINRAETNEWRQIKRCHDINGHQCKGACSRCPRNGEATGIKGRNECCLKDVCSDDCNACSRWRENMSPLSLDAFEGDALTPTEGCDDDDDADGAGSADSCGIEKIVEDKLLLEALVSSLTDDEFALIDALYYQENTMQGYAKQMSVRTDTPVEVWRSRLRRLHESAMKKLRVLLKDWQ